MGLSSCINFFSPVLCNPKVHGILGKNKFMRTIIVLLFSGWLITAFMPHTQLQITGHVYDENGQPLNGVVITEKGKSIGTTTTPMAIFRSPFRTKPKCLYFLL
jgi:hypothetical protein